MTRTVATLSHAVEAVLHPIIVANPWEALLVEAGVPRDVVRAAKQYGFDWTEGGGPHETGEERAKRRITTYLVRWFESSGGERGGEHPEAS
ncbi:MAG: hypothetical protein LC808_09190 [Actinobacteria bacterium]|nr:hypothetical protein [Actinomycetota bacterium]